MDNLLNLVISALVGYIFGTFGIGILITLILHLAESRKLGWWYIQRNILLSLIFAVFVGVPLAKREHNAKIEVLEQAARLGNTTVLNTLKMSGDYTSIYVGVIFGACLGVVFAVPKVIREKFKARVVTSLGSN